MLKSVIIFLKYYSVWKYDIYDLVLRKGASLSYLISSYLILIANDQVSRFMA